MSRHDANHHDDSPTTPRAVDDHAGEPAAPIEVPELIAELARDARRVEFFTGAGMSAESGLATLGAGLSGPAAELLLADHGLQIGHYPQSFPYATIGGYAATRSSGQSSAGYGRFDEMVRSFTIVTPSGILEVGDASPATAAGPDLRELFLGSEGAFGVITRVRLPRMAQAM